MLGLPACLVDFGDADGHGDADTPRCGNNEIDPGELCDLTDLGSETCVSQGYSPGQLSCSPDCTGFVYDGCGGGFCGDALIQEGEACDGSNLGSVSCETLGYGQGGALTCVDCQIDTADCCGDGSLGGNETCDDANPMDWDGCTGCRISEIQANHVPVGSQLFPVVSVAPNGSNIVVVWRDDLGSDPMGTVRVMYRVFGDRGSPLTGDLLASTYDADVDLPDVAHAPDGSFTLVFQCAGDRDGSGWGIYRRHYDSTGAPLISADLVNTTTESNQTHPRIAMNAIGESVVVWDQFDIYGLDQQVMVQRFHADGTPDGPERTVNTASDGDQQYPAVALNDAGDILVAWESTDATTVGYEVFAAWGEAGAAGFEQFLINDENGPERERLQPEVLLFNIDTQSAGLVAWTHTSFLSDPELRVQAFFDATPFGAELVFQSSASGQGRLAPSLTTRDDETVWLFWSERNQDGLLFNFGQIVNLFGQPEADPFEVSIATDFAHGAPRVATSFDQGVVITWSAAGQDGDGSGAFFQRFDPSGQPLGTLPSIQP